MRTGRRLGIDVGKARIGLAISDQSGMLASPFETVVRGDSLVSSVEKVIASVSDYAIIEIYVGLPLKLSGEFSASTQDSIAFARELEKQSEISVRLVDERMTTVTAAANLRTHGINSKSGRKVIDQEAAAIILESALNQEKLNGQTPGKPTSEFE